MTAFYLVSALALLFMLMLLSGCAPTNLAQVIEAASKDDATFCARVTTVYGTATVLRSNIHGGDVSCDTLTIKSTAVPSPFGPGAPPVVLPQAPLSRSERRLQAPN